jgi:hypothetical protein
MVVVIISTPILLTSLVIEYGVLSEHFCISPQVTVCWNASPTIGADEAELIRLHDNTTNGVREAIGLNPIHYDLSHSSLTVEWLSTSLVVKS